MHANTSAYRQPPAGIPPEGGPPEIAAAVRPEVAGAILSLSTQRLARMRLEGGGPPYVRAGRSILYIREDLETWLRANRRRSTADTGIAA